MSDRKPLPPFRAHNCVALAYVSGRYTPPSTKKGAGPSGFLGLYLSRTDPLLSFWTFGRDGRYWAFSRVSDVTETDEGNVSLTLIRGWLDYQIPFVQ